MFLNVAQEQRAFQGKGLIGFCGGFGQEVQCPILLSLKEQGFAHPVTGFVGFGGVSEFLDDPAQKDQGVVSAVFLDKAACL